MLRQRFSPQTVICRNAFGYSAGFQVFYDFLDHDSLNEGAMSASVDAADGRNGSSRNRWNQRLAKIVHKLGPAGSIYDDSTSGIASA